MAKKKETIIHVRLEGDAIKDTEKLSKNIKDVKKESKETSDQFGLMQTGIGRMASGIIAFAKKGVMAMRTLKGAMASTGILLVVIAITSLISYFTKTERGAEKLKVIMAALGQVVSTITDVFIKIGETLAKIGKIIGKVVKGQVTFKEGWKETKEVVGDAVKDLGEGFKKMGDNIERAIALAERENQLRKDRRVNLVEEAKLNVELAQAREKMNDLSLTYEERMRAVNKADETQNKISDERIRLAREQYEITKEQNTLSESTSEDKEKEAQLLADLINLEAERANKQKLFTIKRATLENQEKKRIEKATKDEEKRIEKEIEDEEERIEAEKERVEKYNEEIRKLEEENYLNSLETDEERREAKIELEQEHFEEDLQIKLANEEITNEELLELQEQGNIKFAAQRKKAGDEKIAAQKVLDKIKLDNEKAAQNATLELGILALESLSSMFTKNKELQIALMLVGKIQAVSSIFQSLGEANAKAVAVSPLTFGMPWVGINTGFAVVSIAGIIASAAKSMGEINAVQPPKKALGGFLSGPSHSGGGVLIEGEGGEYIVNKRAMANPQLAQSVIAANIMGNTGAIPLSEERIVEITATIVKAVKVYILDSEMTDKQRKVKIWDAGNIR